MRLFHIANNTNAEAILKDGFRDVMGYHHAGQEWTGVWVSSEPLDWSQRQYLNEANTLFAIEIPEDVISEFEWAEEGKLIREWLIPAELLNSYGPPVVANDYDEEKVPSTDPEEGELLIEWTNERPNVERLRTENPDPGAFMGDFDIGEFLR
ncbi:MAG: hypothetical protein VYA78_05380 [Chloroflexota bacterium]|nr:hypothetical protein [Chloroflexota bacterium]